MKIEVVQPFVDMETGAGGGNEPGAVIERSKEAAERLIASGLAKPVGPSEEPSGASAAPVPKSRKRREAAVSRSAKDAARPRRGKGAK